MSDEPKVDDVAKRERAATIRGLIVAAVAMAILVWSLLDLFLPHNPRDPITKARGLKAEQIK
jgi:hypothetical protein